MKFSVLSMRNMLAGKSRRDVAPIDHTERRRVTFISVDLESQENLVCNFDRILAKENIVYIRASCGIFIEKTDEISRTLH
jgi:hypothetical protein